MVILFQYFDVQKNAETVILVASILLYELSNHLIDYNR